MKTIDIENDSLNKITNNLAKVLVNAFDYSRLRGGNELNVEDLFLSILSLKECLAAKVLERIGVDLESTKERILSRYVNNNSNKVNFGLEAKEILAKSFLISSELGHVYVGTEHLLLSIIQDNRYEFVKDLSKNGINYEILKQAIQNFGVYQPGIFSQRSDLEEDEDKNKSLGFFTKDMIQLAESGKYLKVWGRDEEIERILHILSRRTKNNALLVGEAGVGKTAIVEGLVQRIISGNVPQSFKSKKVVQLDISSIIAGSKIRGDVEERLLGIISEMADNPDIIIFIDEIHMIVGAGTAGAGSTMDVANIIKPYLTNGDLRVIGATTFDEYQKYIEDDQALARRFQTIMVNEIKKDDAINVLKMLKNQFEDFHGVKIPDDVINEAVELSDKYITNKYLPDKAIDVIDEASAAIKIERNKDNKDYEILKNKLDKALIEKENAIIDNNIKKATKLRDKELNIRKEINTHNKKQLKVKKKSLGIEDVKRVISRWSGVPVNTLDINDYRKLIELDNRLKSNIIGQDHIMSLISSSLKRSRIGLSDNNRPLSSFLFLGPTGVGKTQTAKEIANILYNDIDSLIQIDMSEYMEQHSVSKLIGSPPGYIGYQEGGQLTEKVRRKPYSIILFDEIEKAHPDLINILLQILDEGHIQDAKGRFVNFKNCIIIMTSNIGAWDSIYSSPIGFNVNTIKDKDDESYQIMKDKIMESLKDSLSPELINRIDEVLVFRKLNENDAFLISKGLIENLVIKLKGKKINLIVDEAVYKYIVQDGFSADYGARNLKRSVQNILENKLADFLLEKGIIMKNNNIINIMVSISNKKIVFNRINGKKE